MLGAVGGLLSLSCGMLLAVILFLPITQSCQRNSAPPAKTSTPIAPHPALSSTNRLPPAEFQHEPTHRLSLEIVPGAFTLALAPAVLPNHVSPGDDAQDTLHNLAVAPEDLENGWHWAWDIFRNLPPESRAGFLDQVASLTPAWAWSRLDPILQEPAWGTEIMQTLWRRLLDLPLDSQLPRILQIARNPQHPCREQADSLLRTYFPDIQPGNYEEYRVRIVPPTPL